MAGVKFECVLHIACVYSYCFYRTVFTETLMFAQVVKKFSTSYGTHKSIALFTCPYPEPQEHLSQAFSHITSSPLIVLN